MAGHAERVPTVALVTPRAKPGGCELRCSALHEALSVAAMCTRIELACHRRTACGATCRADGLPPRAVPGAGWIDRTYCPVYAEQLTDRLATIGADVVVCSHLDTYRYVLQCAQRSRWKVVFDCHNVEQALHRDMKAAIPPGSRFHDTVSDEHVRMVAVAEGAAVRAAGEVWTCSESDRSLLRSTYALPAQAAVRVVPNVVAVADAPPAPASPRRVCFLGRLDYYPNVRAARFLMTRIAPRLSGSRDGLPVVIAGAQPGPELLELDRAEGVELLADPSATAQLTRGSIVAVPLTEGGGSRFKILEAFRDGAPVVSTAKGVEGLDVEDGVHCLLADTADEFATAIIRLKRDAALRHRLTTAAWRLVRDRYSTGWLGAELARSGI